ncbi:MAG: hypothetical protein ACTHJR_09035 [Sphingomonas sp.]
MQEAAIAVECRARALEPMFQIAAFTIFRPARWAITSKSLVFRRQLANRVPPPVPPIIRLNERFVPVIVSE